MSINISDFSLFLCKNSPPNPPPLLEKGLSLFSQQSSPWRFIPSPQQKRGMHTLVLLYHLWNINEAHKLIFFAEQRGIAALEKKGNLLNYESCLLSISNSSVNHIKSRRELKHLLKHTFYFKRAYVNTKQSIVITYDTKNWVSPFQLSVAFLYKPVTWFEFQLK